MLSPGLTLCKEEAALVGAMVVNYGELEFCLAQCLGAVIGNNVEAFRLFYKDRGEEKRIILSERQMRDFFVGIRVRSLASPPSVFAKCKAAKRSRV